ncbi:MAG: NAD(P)/FAD-dependent oxidoreductase [Firmicutes bacterium]|nr:NAD(P)/FAD-dependent oxidoreductase [Bacillota bacterium]MCL5038984.1 NAD(P)/FAD-dependent oxidoreductase [Bacillota bacterium]
MRQTNVLVIGGGPAGLSAATAAAQCGARVILVDSSSRLGGQLIKQTHKFFGSREQRAGTRGIEIARLLQEEAEAARVEILPETAALGLYSDGVVTLEKNERLIKLKPERLVVATGASEKTLAFANNDLPGIYGAGAVQTLMNVHGVRPGQRAVMVGAGNIGLIVSYQLCQAGVEVAAVVEAAPSIGGYAVHASKIRRLGIPILTSYSIKAAHGGETLEGVTVWQLNEKWQGIPGTEQVLAADILCLAVGLTPLTELLWQAGCQMEYIPELGGHVPWYDENQQTSVPGIYVAGDAAAVEEASSAMVTGKLAGLASAHSLGLCPDFPVLGEKVRQELTQLRAGPTGEKIRKGLGKLRARSRPGAM